MTYDELDKILSVFMGWREASERKKLKFLETVNTVWGGWTWTNGQLLPISDLCDRWLGFDRGWSAKGPPFD